ncbi:TadE-like protein [Actinomyces bovis]|uniref:TadE-like protein n=1 Tax=Actinomyces bovis TaxID=1658 RepID=A0ABY1VKV0_9ACTO|nr:TadE/TadG family type IV pilus assembly protein [Actinomyces bovis]SPT52729.1 TadE-like protein [Actinomyces bovis]VEG54702.1 TadE-like protein [Actinomyces israelii]
MVSELRKRHPEAGSAPVDFALVSVLVVALGLAVLQLALGLHVRNVLTDAAGEGARRAALLGGTEAEAQERVSELVSQALTADYLQEVQVTRTSRNGLAVVQVTATAPLPVIGLLGPGGTLRVTAHAVDEAALTNDHPPQEKP